MIASQIASATNADTVTDAMPAANRAAKRPASGVFHNAFSSQLMEPVVKITISLESDANGSQSCYMYNVHESILFKQSAYFERIFQSDCIEARTREVNLGTEVGGIEAWELLLEYFYSGRYAYHTLDGNDWVLLDSKVYVLAERLQCPYAKAYALAMASDTFQKTYDHAKGIKTSWEVITGAVMPEVIKVIYANTYDNSLEILTRKLQLEEEGATTQDVDKCDEVLKKDPFRTLLCRFCAAVLPKLLKVNAFVKTHHETPEFAMDLLQFLQAGDNLGWETTNSKPLRGRRILS
ncbi:hypothetical protein ABW19_dt0202682 [Dactylella cylindrospora]|nr:hypothetical protein ABW19_dt0202682 [Dactylella cylindrospora]